MAAHISAFPMLNDDLKDRLRIEPSPYTFYFEGNDGEERELQADLFEGSMNTYKISDSLNVWDQDIDNICFRRHFSLETFKYLFGENGIACNDATLGVAIRWTSSDSQQRGVVKVGEFTKDDDEFEEDVEFKFSKAQLRGEFALCAILYIASSGKAYSAIEKTFANKEGFVLGELEEEQSFKIDGQGSIFPIYEIEKPGAPLWTVECDWEDSTESLFSETVSININKAHKSYKYIDQTAPTYNSQLLKEVISAALSIIIIRLKEDENGWDATINGNDLLPGSVSHAVNYFLTSFGWDTYRPELISLSIRDFFDKRI